MSNVLIEKNKLDILANAISNKSGEPLKLTLDEMVEAVDGIENNPAPTLQAKTYTVDSAGTETITADNGYDGLSEVEVSVPSAIVVAEVADHFFTQNNVRKWEVYANAANFNEGYLYYGQVAQDSKIYNAIPTGTTVTPTESAQTIGGADTMLEGAVTVSAIPSNYVGSGITRRSSLDLTVSGATVTAPSGYYSASASKSVASGTAGTPTATKGTVSNHSVSVTPSVTNTTGYITGSTKTGTAVTVSASELVSGTKSITGNGTGIDVTNYASVDVAVQSGMDVPIFTPTYNQSTGVVTVTCNKTYEQCEDLVFIDGETTAVIDFGDGVYFPLEGFCEDGTKVQYFGTEQGVPSYEIVYNYNGTITFNDQSSVLDTLSVTENGTYTPPSGKVYNEVVVNVSGGGSSTISVGKTTKTLASASSSIQFTGLSGNPTSFAVTSSADITTNTNGVTAVVFDGTSLHGQILSTQATADTGFTKSYSGGTLTITATTGTFQANEYKLVYTYGGSTSDIETANVQVGSGATSITFSVTGRPIYWSCIFKSDFSTSSGYQRVIEVVDDGSSTYGMCLDSSAHASSSYWTASYSGGSLTISSQGTNAGGYFHQPGYYQLTYIVDESAPSYQTKTVTPTTSQQVVTADTGYDALEEVIVNAMPSMTLPSSTSATSSGTSKATISASSSTQYLNIPTGYNATAQYYTISASGGGSSKNVQVLQSTSRTNSSSLTKVLGDLTVSKTGTYDVYWSGGRSNTSTSYTWGTRLYIDGTGYGTENTSWSNNCQSNHLSNVSLTANQKLSVYARGRTGSYYTFAPMLAIVEA